MNYLISNGALGDVPDEYRLFRAARLLNVPPWELAQQSPVWMEWALLFESAEAKAQELLDKQRPKNRPR